MQEKDIKEKLNQELDKMAPDILNKILATPIEPVKSEKELFGKNKPLFKENVDWKRYIWAPAITAAVACLLIVIILFQPQIGDTSITPKSGVAFSVTIDVNPSIDIKVKKDGTIKSVKAGNKDAVKIVKQINEKIDKDTDYDKAIELVMKQLRSNGYLKEEKNAMLVSVVSDNKATSKDKLTEIKERTKKAEESKKIKCTTMYQACETDKKTKEVAKENNVSLGKAALCVKIAEKEKTSVKKLCKENIDTLIKKTEKAEIAVNNDEIVIEEVLYFEPETTETETETYIETETVSETIGLLDDETTEGESSDNEEETMEIDTKEAEPTIGLLP